MRENRNLFEKKLTATVGVFTWNLAGKGPTYDMDISKYVLPDSYMSGGDSVQPDFYIVGL